jgi:hypothetical protein
MQKRMGASTRTVISNYQTRKGEISFIYWGNLCTRGADLTSLQKHIRAKYIFLQAL